MSKGNIFAGWCKTWLPLVVCILAFVIWIYIIAFGDAKDKANWLLLPFTGIYVSVSVYLAIASIRASRSNEKTVEVMTSELSVTRDSLEIMRQTLEEMRMNRSIEHLPVLSFPEGRKCGLPKAGTAHLRLRNLVNVPIIGLSAMFWELEDTVDSIVKYSTMRESQEIDIPSNQEVFDIDMGQSNRSDEDKREKAQGVLAKFAEKPKYSICVISFLTRADSVPIKLYFDLELDRGQ